MSTALTIVILGVIIGMLWSQLGESRVRNRDLERELNAFACELDEATHLIRALRTSGPEGRPE